MSTPLATAVAIPRLTDEELAVYDGILKDCEFAQKRSRPTLGIFGTKRRYRKQNFVIIGEAQERPIEFDDFQFHDYKTSAVQMDGTEESLKVVTRVIEILESMGHHFAANKPEHGPAAKVLIRQCEMTPVLIFTVEVKGDEPEL